MGGLFQGAPQAATSYTTSSTETPKWMQDAIYNQIQVAQNVANTPYQKYDQPTVAELSPLQQKAYQQVQNNQGFYQNSIDSAQTGMQGFSNKGTADALQQAQGQYTQPSLVGQNLNAGQGYYNAAGNAANNIQSAAQPYMAKASQSAAGGINQYMSPYQSGVMDVIAKQAGRNLSENLLPNVSDAFIKAGSFGGTRMGEFGSRAVRDTQEAVLNQQAQLANQGYNTALGASQSDQARQAQLAGTAGNLANQQTSALTGLGQAQTGAGQAQQQFGLNAAQAGQTAQAQDYARQMSALQQFAGMQQQEQAMRSADVASLEGAGAAQQNQMQQQLTAAKNQFDDQANYTKKQADWMNNQIRGIAPSVPQTTTQNNTTTGNTYSPSPLSQLATGLYAYKGLKGLGE